MVQENNPSSLTKEDLVKLLRSNIKAFNKHREQTDNERLDLSDTKLQGTTLTGANLQNIDFSTTNFEYANLVSANLSNCNLKNALLIYSNLNQANLTGADLETADCTGAQLEGANLDHANISMSLFSQANVTNVSMNETDVESANFCSANLTNTNLKTTLNLKYCIFDKFTRWPADSFLPKDFNPGRGMYGSDEDFSISVNENDSYSEHDSFQEEAMSPDELKSHLMDQVEITGKGLPEIEKKQILLDRKLDFVIASLKILTEKVVAMPEGGVQRESGEGYYDSYDSGSGGINAKLQELDDKIESVAGILTRFPVKSLEETYKLMDVIHRIEESQGQIYQELNKSLGELHKANEEIQSLTAGKLRASYISGLDKMFENTLNGVKESIEKSQVQIISENNKLDFNLDESFIVNELEKQVKATSQLIRDDLERKLGTHGLFLKQIDEKLEKVQEKTDVQSLFNQLRDEVESKLNQQYELTEGAAEKSETRISDLTAKLKEISVKIDIMSETSTLGTVSNLIAEFGSGFSSELQMVKDAAIAIENRLKGLTGEADLSTDFAIESIAKAVNVNLAGEIATAINKASLEDSGVKDFFKDINHKLEMLAKMLDSRSDASGMKEFVDNINHKLELFGKILDAKTSNLETTLQDAVRDVSSDKGIAPELQELKDLSASLANQINELKNAESEPFNIEPLKEELVARMKDVLLQAKEYSSDLENSDMIESKAELLHEMSTKISEKLDSLYSNFDERSDVLEEKVDDINQSELEDLMADFSKELEELRGSVGSLDSNTRETIKIQGISSQEIINSLREDLTASVDEVLGTIRNLEEEGLLGQKGSNLNDIQEDLSQKAELLKGVTDRISNKMESLFENINKKTGMLEQKVDILAQAESDSADVINHLLAGFEEDLNTELHSLREMLGSIEERLEDPSFKEASTQSLTQNIMNKLQDKVECAVDRTNEEIIRKITGIGSVEEKEKTESTIRPEDYDDSIQGDIDYIKDLLVNIHDKLPKYNEETAAKVADATKIINDKLEDLHTALTSKTGTLESVMNEIVKESSSIPAAGKSFDISSDIEQLKALAMDIEKQMKQVESMGDHESVDRLKEIKGSVEYLVNQSKALGLEDLDYKVSNLKELGDQITDRMKQFAGSIGDHIDISEQLNSVAESEAAELLDEFSSELDEIREFIQTNANLTRDSLQAQNIMNEESINTLREDMTSAIDRMTGMLSGLDEGTFNITPNIQKVGVESEIAEKKELMKEVTSTISNKMESLLSTIENKTNTLEQKVDILAQSDSDSQDVVNEMLYDFKEDIIRELKGKVGSADGSVEDSEADIKAIMTLAKDIHDKVSTIEALLDTTPHEQIGEMIKESLENVNIGEVIKLAMIESNQGSYEAIIAKEVSQILEVVSSIKGDIEASGFDNFGDIVKESLQEVNIGEIIKLAIADSNEEPYEAVLVKEVAEILETVNSIKGDIQASGFDEIGQIVESSVLKSIDTSDVAREVSDMYDKLVTIEHVLNDANPKEVVDMVNEFEVSLSDKIESLRDVTEDVHNNLVKLDETILGNVMDKLNNLIDNNVQLDTDVLIDSIKTELEDKISKLNMEDLLQNSVADLAHKIDKLYEDVMDLSISIETRLETIAEKDSTDEIIDINDNLIKLKEINLELSEKFEQLSGEISADAMTDMITDLETSLSREVEYIKNIGESINQNFSDLEKTIDIEKVENSLNELIEFNSEIGSKLDKVLDATGNIDSEALLESIKEHIEEKLTDVLDQDMGLEKILDSLGSDLTEKLALVIDNNQEIDTKLDKILDHEYSKDALMSEIHSIKATALELNKKLDILRDENANLSLEEHIMELQSDIRSKMEMIVDVVNPETIVNSVNDSIEGFYEGVMERTNKLQDQLQSITTDELAEGLDNITTDISLLRTLTEDVNEKLNRVIGNTEGLQTEEGMIQFRKTLEEKLNAIIEADESLNLESLLSTIGNSLGEKIDEYSNTTRDYISDVISTLEENIIAESKEVCISDFVDNAEQKVLGLQQSLKDMVARIEIIQDISENSVLTKADVEDLFTNIDAITVSLSEKTDAVLSKVESKLDSSGLNNVKVLRREMETRLDALNQSTNAIKESLNVDFEGAMSDKLNIIGQSMITKVDEIATHLVEETQRLEEKVDSLAIDDIVSQIDALVSDVLVELDKEVGRIGKITANIDKNIITLDNNVTTIDTNITNNIGAVDSNVLDVAKISGELGFKVDYVENKLKDIDNDIKRLPELLKAQEDPKSESDNAIAQLIGYMQKDADQKLILMKELIHSSSGRGPGGELEQRMKKLEAHITAESEKHDKKLVNVLGSMKTLLGDLEGLKAFTPLPQD